MTKADLELQSLAVASGRVAVELRGLQDRVERLEEALDQLYRNPSIELDAHTLGTLQDVDFLAQSIAALSSYLGHLSSSARKDGHVCIREAIEAMPLRDMANRLRSGQERPGTASRNDHAELF